MPGVGRAWAVLTCLPLFPLCRRQHWEAEAGKGGQSVTSSSCSSSRSGDDICAYRGRKCIVRLSWERGGEAGDVSPQKCWHPYPMAFTVLTYPAPLRKPERWHHARATWPTGAVVVRGLIYALSLSLTPLIIIIIPPSPPQSESLLGSKQASMAGRRKSMPMTVRVRVWGGGGAAAPVAVAPCARMVEWSGWGGREGREGGHQARACNHTHTIHYPSPPPAAAEACGGTGLQLLPARGVLWHDPLCVVRGYEWRRGAQLV